MLVPAHSGPIHRAIEAGSSPTMAAPVSRSVMIAVHDHGVRYGHALQSQRCCSCFSARCITARLY
jgi:hypothetical protein